MRLARIELAPDACLWNKVRDTRIELVSQPWEGRILPLNQSRTLFQSLGTGIAWDAIPEVLPKLQPHIKKYIVILYFEQVW